MQKLPVNQDLLIYSAKVLRVHNFQGKKQKYCVYAFLQGYTIYESRILLHSIYELLILIAIAFTGSCMGALRVLKQWSGETMIVPR